MKLDTAAQLSLFRTKAITATGTHDGAEKGWDTRGRGRNPKAGNPPKLDYQQDLTSEKPNELTWPPKRTTPKELLLRPGIKVERSDPGTLTPAQHEVEERFATQIEKDPQGAIDDYRNGTKDTKPFGNVVNPDNAKELSIDYRADRSIESAVHEPSSWLAKQVYKQILAEPLKPGQYKTAFFATGGPGVGKTTGIEANKTLSGFVKNSHVVVDGTFANSSSAMQKIDQALATGHSAIVAYVHRDPADAFENGVLSRAEHKDANGQVGRTVPISFAAKAYINVRNSLDKLVDHYKDNPQVHFVGIDNTHGLGNAKFMPYQNLPPMKESAAQLSAKFHDILDDAYTSGKISQKTYQAINK